MPSLMNSFLNVPDCSKKQWTLPLISIAVFYERSQTAPSPKYLLTSVLTASSESSREGNSIVPTCFPFFNTSIFIFFCVFWIVFIQFVKFSLPSCRHPVAVKLLVECDLGFKIHPLEEVVYVVHDPECPNPPLPLSVSSRSSTTSIPSVETFWITSCAIRCPSLRRIWNGSWLWMITPTSPR